MRIVSLLPSATEIICALGARAALVGVSHECDHPADVRRLPAITAPRLRVDDTSAGIDRSVRALVERGLAVYEIDTARLRTLAPDVIVTQDQCDVCAVPFRDVEAAARQLFGSSVSIVSLSPRGLDDVWRDIERVGATLEREREAAAVVAAGRARLAAVAEATAGRARPTVACIEWLDPLMLAANWVPELVEIAGGTYPFAAAGDASATATWAALAAESPEVVVVMPCGFTIARTRAELPALAQRSEWQVLPAVAAGRAHVVDGNAYFNRPGPRLVESAEILASVFHPDAGSRPPPPDAVEAIVR